MAEAAKDDMSNRAERRDKGRSFVGGEGGGEGVRGHDGRTDGASEGPTMTAAAATILTVALA